MVPWSIPWRAKSAEILLDPAPRKTIRTKPDGSLNRGPAERLAYTFKDTRLPPVPSTPVMIKIIEHTALNALKAYLELGDAAEHLAGVVGFKPGQG
jgi:hypothetical protein